MFLNFLKTNSNFTVKRYESFLRNLECQLRIPASKLVPPNSARSFTSLCKHRFFISNIDLRKKYGNLEAFNFVPTRIQGYCDKIEELVPSLREVEEDDDILVDEDPPEPLSRRQRQSHEADDLPLPLAGSRDEHGTGDDVDSAILAELKGLSLLEKRRLLNMLDKPLREEHGGGLGGGTLTEALTRAAEEIREDNVIELMAAVKTGLRTNPSFDHIPHYKNTLGTLVAKVRKLYPVMSTEELLLVLYCFDKMEMEASTPPIRHILQILKFHMNNLSIRNIVQLDFTLKRQSDPAAKLISSTLSVVAENVLNGDEQLSSATLRDLLVFAGFCIQNQVKDTYRVLDELSVRGIISPRFAMSLVWNLFSLPGKPFFQFLVPPDSEITVEILTKECLTIMARNISEYTPEYLNTTLSKAVAASERGHDFAYHEGFLLEVARRAVDEEWTFPFLTGVALKLFELHFVDEALLLRAYSSFLAAPAAFDSNKLLYLISPLCTCLNRAPPDFELFLQFALKKKDVTKRTNNPWRAVPFTLKVAEILSLDCFPQTFLETALSKQNMDTVLRNITSFRSKDLFRLLLANRVLKATPSARHFCLPEGTKSRMFETLSRRRAENAGHAGRNASAADPVHDVIQDARCVVSDVHYQGELFIDKLLVVDEEGRPVPVLPRDERLWSPSRGFCSFDDLYVDPSHRRIALLSVDSNRILRPDGKHCSVLRLVARCLESEGFSVVVCTFSHSAEERAEYLQRDLDQLGVKL